MLRPIKPVLFGIVVLAATVSAVYTLNLLDQVVNGLTYTYGYLQFDLRWANPYWNLLHIVQILLGVIAASTVLNMLLTIRKFVSTRRTSEETALSRKPTRIAPSVTHRAEKEIIPQPQNASTLPLTQSAPPHAAQPVQPTHPMHPATLPADISGLIKCVHCGKLFSQPLRMLDFQGDRPRIVSICPFCSEIITAAPRQGESEQDKRFQFRKKNDDHVPRTWASQ